MMLLVLMLMEKKEVSDLGGDERSGAGGEGIQCGVMSVRIPRNGAGTKHSLLDVRHVAEPGVAEPLSDARASLTPRRGPRETVIPLDERELGAGMLDSGAEGQAIKWRRAGVVPFPVSLERVPFKDADVHELALRGATRKRKLSSPMPSAVARDEAESLCSFSSAFRTCSLSHSSISPSHSRLPSSSTSRAY